MSLVLPLRTGWDPEPCDPLWYPQDLPPEWRLGYFSNACRCVLVPARQWRAATPALAAAWAADTSERFRFYLETECATAVDWPPTGSQPLARALGVRLGGLVGPAASETGRRPFRGPRTATSAWEVPAAAIADLRKARRWIEERVAQPPDGTLLALLGRCRLADLERWQTLSELMN